MSITTPYHLSMTNTTMTTTADTKSGAGVSSFTNAECAMSVNERARLIAMLEANDRNGCYSDEDSIAEFGSPATIEELRESAARQWLINTTPCECGGKRNSEDECDSCAEVR